MLSEGERSGGSQPYSHGGSGQGTDGPHGQNAPGRCTDAVCHASDDGTTEPSALPEPRPGAWLPNPMITIQSNLWRRKNRCRKGCLQEVSQQVTGGSRILHAVTPLSAVNKFITSCNHHRINIYSQMTRCQAIQGERTVFSANGRKLDGHLQKNEADLYLTPYTKTNSKWIKELMQDLEQ